ncbi:MAG: hypothetical protein C4527_17750 [Candidatus Omnitrophota bacterium]|jgi:hypothetical protein|nr:MAG: hypothetical protein C4527_17750 [Candidatus Omnitrophota bacterium]
MASIVCDWYRAKMCPVFEALLNKQNGAAVFFSALIGHPSVGHYPHDFLARIRLDFIQTSVIIRAEAVNSQFIEDIVPHQLL